MSDDKAAAAYHPGDSPATRPDLDALITRLNALDQKGLDDAAALAAERERADHAAAKVTAVEALRDKWLRDGEQPDLWIAVNRALSAAPTVEQ